ncbi:MAG: acyl carrier protein [Chitinophagaceae bacterium]|nr:MAG: acyl carrier protein [Chitinophagaceae bacterium]
MDTKLKLTELISDETGLAASEISGDENFENLNMDSLSVVSLAFELEKLTGIEPIEPGLFIEYNTVNKLATWVDSRQ